MIWIALMSGLVAALLLIGAGYMMGAKRGRDVRAALEHRLADSHAQPEGSAELRHDLKRLLLPLVERERMQLELAHVGNAPMARSQLQRLLDDIATKGGFSSVLLSDESGLPVAATSDQPDSGRMAGVTAIVLLMADRIARDGAPNLSAVMVRDASDCVVLHRLFHVDRQRLVLTAIQTGGTLSPNALDPTLAGIERALRAA